MTYPLFGGANTEAFLQPFYSYDTIAGMQGPEKRRKKHDADVTLSSLERAAVGCTEVAECCWKQSCNEPHMPLPSVDRATADHTLIGRSCFPQPFYLTPEAYIEHSGIFSESARGLRPCGIVRAAESGDSDDTRVPHGEYVSLRTCDDCACGLHVVFCHPSAEGKIHCPHARNFAADLLRPGYGQASAAITMPKVLADIVRMLWHDYALPYARHRLYRDVAPVEEAMLLMKRLAREMPRWHEGAIATAKRDRVEVKTKEATVEAAVMDCNG